MRKDLKQFGIDESSWFHKAQDRLYWRAVCKEGLTACTEERQRKRRSAHGCGPHAAADAPTPAAPLLVCLTCSRTFRRRQDIARHKCQTTLATHFSYESGKCCSISVCHFVAEKHHLLQMAFFQGPRFKVCVIVIRGVRGHRVRVS